MINKKGNTNFKWMLLLLGGFVLFSGCRDTGRRIGQVFEDPPGDARPWVFWYWINASVSREGITADLEAMQEAGIGGACLMPIRGAQDPPWVEPAAVQLTPLWWEMVLHALKEADRLGLKIGMHLSDGFALAGGPWISPPLSMQKVVWSEIAVAGGKTLDTILPQPETREGYYRDIALFAFPSPPDACAPGEEPVPEVSCSLPGQDPGFLADRQNNRVFRSQDSCWIQYAFEQPFTCRNISIRTRGYNIASHRLWVQTSEDGKNFQTLCRLEPPRHGWQEESEEVLHAIRPVTARYFRFVYDKQGGEPGAEDLEMAKWSDSLGIRNIYLSGSPRLHQYRGKSGAIWRISPATTGEQIPENLCIRPEGLLDLSGMMDSTGRLRWEAPEGRWNLLRMGHTSTGKTNYTGGGGLGLECDKFNPEAVRLQFESWFGEVIEKAGPDLADRVLKILHVDSWECGSQNWSPVFREEFTRRRGYDPIPFLPAMAGIPVQSVEASEAFLLDVRRTISELLIDNFYEVLAEKAHGHGCEISAECVAPTMVSDGILHYKSVDLPMGEFWLRSPTHDKPNDMLDAVSGAHVYGKQIVQAEAFTELRMNWGEHPAQLKSLGDRNLALGINRLFIHVFAHNPWIDRQPGMTLSRNGLFFQRDQTWWRPGRAWVEYLTRCQALLQQGRHVADIAVFTGEEIPARAILPDRLVPLLPGIFGPGRVQSERLRLANEGAPQAEMPEGVHYSANMADPGDWCDPLNGYAYDSFNPDVLLNLASIRDGKILLPGGAGYSLLIIPGARRMNPGGDVLSDRVVEKIRELRQAGATLLLDEDLKTGSGQYLKDVLGITGEGGAGPGRAYLGPWEENDFGRMGLEPDFQAFNRKGERAAELAWTHRRFKGGDLYFISNQSDRKRDLVLSLRTAGRWPDLYDPLNGTAREAGTWNQEGGRTRIPVILDPNGSLFVVLERKTGETGVHRAPNQPVPVKVMGIEGPWELGFNPGAGGPDTTIILDTLESWHLSSNPGIRFYSGTAIYRNTFSWSGTATENSPFWLEIEGVHNLAEVFLNGEPCGIMWTEPYRLPIGDRLQAGDNLLEIQVTNTWANRLIGDRALPPEERISWTTDRHHLEGKPLLEAGLTGRASILK